MEARRKERAFAERQAKENYRIEARKKRNGGRSSLRHIVLLYARNKLCSCYVTPDWKLDFSVFARNITRRGINRSVKKLNSSLAD